MKREQARIIVLVIAAWVMGALLGSQAQLRAKAGIVRFPAGIYQIEPTEDGAGPVYWMDYPAEWQARLLTR